MLGWLRTLSLTPARYDNAELRAAYQALSQRHQALAESENRYRLLVDTAAEGIWMLDRNAITTYANAAMQEMLACTDSMVGRALADFLFPEDRAQAQLNLHRRMAGIKEKHEFRFRRADGGEVFTIVSASPLIDVAGEVTGMLGFVTDISERMLFDRQLQALNEQLELRVEERTRALEASNRDLAREVIAREYMQEELRSSNERLNHYLQELERHNGDITRLNYLSDQLHSCDTRGELVQVVERGCEDIFVAAGGILLEWCDDRLAVIGAPWGVGATVEWALTAEMLEALRQGLLFPNCVEQQTIAEVSCVTPQGYLQCVPLHSRDGGFGVLGLLRNEPFWSGDSIADPRLEQMLRAQADHTALALTNLNLRERLWEQSLSDPLTGLYNRRYLYQQMERQISLWERSGQTFAVLLLDVDHFKSFNDCFGHDVGDEVLVELANVLRNHIRKSDIACRLGGEEFVVLMSAAGQEQAIGRAEGIREAVKALRISSVDTPQVSVSVGVAIYPTHGSDAHRLVRAADKALYDSKRSGRDRTSLANLNEENPL